MRRVVTGVGTDGRSTVISDGVPPVAFIGRASSFAPSLVKGDPAHVSAGPGEGLVRELWGLPDDPSVTTDDPTVGLTEPDFNTPAGATKWIITEMGPGLDVPMHHTPTIDYGLVIAGDVEIGLETGGILLNAGDAVVVNGVKHSWHAGPKGCLIATVLVGLRESER